MQNLPFDKPGRFYRGNIHTHTTRSDGGREVAEVVALYRDNGYDFVSITDHFLERYNFPITDTRAYNTDTFTTILGAELHGPALGNGERWHLVAAGLPADFAPATPDETGPQLAARAAEAGAFVGIAHPAWYGLTVEDALMVEAAHAVEIYNETCAQESDRGDSWYVSDQLSAGGRRLAAYAADDAHLKERADSLAAWVHVRAEALEPAALVTALKAGHFYSSQGPEIQNVVIDGDQMHIACSPASLVFVAGPRSLSRAARGSGLTEITLPIERFHGSFCRVTVIDQHGKRAWTNPIWLD